MVKLILYFKHQFVSLTNFVSFSKPMQIGVPQRSILGLFLFLVFVKNLQIYSNAIANKPRVFANDTCFNFKQFLSNPAGIKVQSKRNIWKSGSAKINPSKSSALVIRSRLNSPKLKLNIYYNDCLINCQEIYKNCGVYFNLKLHFQPHILHCTSNQSKIC